MSVLLLFIRYALPITVAVSLLWVAYRLLFVNSNRFQFNRFFLIGALLFSAVLPFLGLEMDGTIPQMTALRETLFPGFRLNEITIVAEGTLSRTTSEATTMAPVTKSFSLWPILGTVYLVGVAVMTLLFLIKLGRIVALIIRSPKRKMDGFTAVYTHKDQGSFSFFHYAFFPDENVSDDIVRHEMSHIAHGHSRDIVFVELVAIFQWFNPFIYCYKRELQSLHEYAADHDVVNAGVDKKNYMMLILQQCTAVDFSTMSNNFSLILTKKRIKMITQHEKAKGFWWKLLATIPVLAVLLLVAVNCQTNDKTGMVNDKDTLEAEQYDHQVDNAMTQDELPMSGEDNVYDVVEVAPEFPGGMSEMANYLSSNITYPQEARDQGIQGRVFIGFVVEKDGSVTEVEVLRGIGESCDNEAVRVVQAMPKWQPGIQDGKPVRVRYNLPINFKLQ